MLQLPEERLFFEKLPGTSKKLVSVLATSMSMTDNSGKEVALKKRPCIHYRVWFQESQEQIKALLDSGSEVNAMSPVYVKRLVLKTRKTNIRAQKIDGSAL